MFLCRHDTPTKTKDAILPFHLDWVLAYSICRDFLGNPVDLRKLVLVLECWLSTTRTLLRIQWLVLIGPFSSCHVEYMVWYGIECCRALLREALNYRIHALNQIHTRDP
jgi:hypothetical protein